MATISELMKLYFRGFKQLFSHKERGGFSFLKVIIFLLYVSAYIFAFLQFIDTNISPAAIQMYQEYQDNNPSNDFMQMFPLSIYGKIALILNFSMFAFFIFFFLTRDKPITVKRIKHLPQQILDYIKLNKFKTLVIVSIMLIICLVALILSINALENEYTEQVGLVFFDLYWIQKAGVIIWLVISPFLVFSALVVSLDLFAKDHPTLMRGFNKRLVLIFVCFFALSLVGQIPLTGILSGEEILWTDDPIPVEGLEGVLFYEKGLEWISIGLWIGIAVIFVLIVVEIVIGLLSSSTELRERRKAITLSIFPFIIFFVFLKALPFVFSFEPRLKTLNSVIDLISLLTIIFFSVFRVLLIQEDDKPKHWSDVISPYSKVLFLLFLAFSSFYVSLEAHMMLAQYNVINMFRLVTLYISLGVFLFWILYIFWSYKPISGMVPSNEKRAN